MGALDDLEERAAQDRRVLRAQLAILSHRLTPEHLAQEALDAAIGGITQRLSSRRGRQGQSAISAAMPLAVAALGGLSRPRSHPLPPTSRIADTPMPRRAPLHPGGDPTPVQSPINPEGDFQMSDHTPNHTLDHTDTGSKVAAGLSRAKETATASLDALRARIDHGLEDLPEEARQRIRRAREAAMNARAEVEAKASMAADAARTTAREKPLLVGALAFAAGATIAAALPRTSVENRAIGARRDQLFNEAERIYREERAKLAQAASDALEAGRDQAKAALEDGKATPKSAA